MADPSANIPNPPDPNTLAATMGLPQSTMPYTPIHGSDGESAPANANIFSTANASPMDSATAKAALDVAKRAQSGVVQQRTDTAQTDMIKSQLDQILAGLPQAERDKTKAEAEAQGQIAAATAEARKTLMETINSLKAKPPTPVDAPPDFQPQSPLERFGSLSSMIGIFASAFTKKAAVNALNASGAAMKAANAGDQEAYDRSYQKWKDHGAEVLKGLQEDRERLKDIGDLQTKDIGLAQAQYTALAADKGWTALALLNQAGDLEGIVSKVAEPLAKAQNGYKDFLESLNIKDKELDIEKKEHDKGGTKALEAIMASSDSTPEEVADAKKKLENIAAAKRTSYILSDEDYDSLKVKPEVVAASEAMYKGVPPNVAMPGAFRSNAPEAKAAMRLAKENHPDWDMSQAELQFKALSSAESKQGAAAQSLAFASSLLTQSIPAVKAAAKAVDLDSNTDINKIIGAYKEHMNDPDWTNFRTQMRAMTGDYAMLVSRGHNTVHSDEEALGVLNQYKNLGSIEGFQKAAEIEEKNVKTSIVNTQKSIVSGDIFKDQSANSAAKSTSSAPAPKGVDPELWKYLTPEEQAGWGK